MGYTPTSLGTTLPFSSLLSPFSLVITLSGADPGYCKGEGRGGASDYEHYSIEGTTAHVLNVVVGGGGGGGGGGAIAVADCCC